MKKQREISRAEGLQKMMKVMDRYWENPSRISDFSEQDLKTKFIVPMLKALNWNIYDVAEVKEQKDFHGLLPDFILTDKHGKIILVEVKPPSEYGQLEMDMKKYRDKPVVRENAQMLLLTTFRNSRICALGKKKGVRKIEIPCADYVTDFNRLWDYLSNSEEGFRTRTVEKALAPRG